MSSRTRTEFRCRSCGVAAPRWSGRCGGCGDWNTLEEETRVMIGSAGRVSQDRSGPRPLDSVDAATARPVPTGVEEFDRLLSGGLVPGSVTLLSGPPGVGKSTLALQVALARTGPDRDGTVVYVAAEESAAQVRRRGDRLGSTPVSASLLIATDVSIDAITSAMHEHRGATVIVDSIQTVVDPDVPSGPGSTAQVRACAQRLADTARASAGALILIGHVTKDGSIAGPRTLEHLVDTVVAFDDDAPHGLRLVRATKHRHGPTGELGVFSMDATGLHGVVNAGGLFLENQRQRVPGSVVTPVVEGRRTLLTEVQALAGGRSGGAPARVCQGIESKRVEMILAVLSRVTGIEGDVFVSLIGGMRVREPAIDLAVAAAVVSAATETPIDVGTTVCGELSLVGEVRHVPSVPQRVREAARLGFTRAIVPRSTPKDIEVPGIEVCRVANLANALSILLGAVVPVRVGRGATSATSSQQCGGHMANGSPTEGLSMQVV